MKTSTKVKIATIAGAGLTYGISAVHATPLINTDAFDFLPDLGTAVGGFVQNLFNGLLPVIVVIVVLAAVAGIIYAIAHWFGKMGSSLGGRRR